MMNKEQIAGEKFLEGYNCAQAVAVTFREELGLDEQTIAKSVSGFGGGMGRMREVCGAVSGMIYVLSCLEGYSNPKEKDGKIALYKTIQNLAKQFEQKQGSLICRELLKGVGVDASPNPSPRTAEYYHARGCKGCVECATGILAKYLRTKSES